MDVFPTAPSQPIVPHGPPVRSADPGARHGMRASRDPAQPVCLHRGQVVSSEQFSSAMVALPSMYVRSLNQ
eukprot:1605133-Prymnesium_polylepis.1